MWVYQYQPLLNGLLQKALVELCTQSLPWEGRLEIDGIFCVSGKDPSQQIVIKIHKALEKPEPKNQPKQANRNHPPGNKKVLIEAGKIVSTKEHTKNPTKKSNLMPLNLSLPNLKSGASVTQNIPISLATSASLSGNPKSLTVGNQSLRALLGAKAAEGSVIINESGEEKLTGTILKQPQTGWLKNNAEEISSIKKEQDTESDASSDRKANQDLLANVKEEPVDMESESSVDLDEETLPATNVTCKICSIVFENFQALQSHTLATHKRYACRQCCNTFSLRCNLRRHERLHAGVKPHSCSYCKKSFSRSADLKAHLRKHDSQKTPDWISCSKCPKSFRSAVNLRLHMYKVHKEKDCVYACDICEKVFHDPDEFQNHRDTHTASLVQGGRFQTDSACSTPVVNGSQDSLDEDGFSSDDAASASDEEINFNEVDGLVNSAAKKHNFLEELSNVKSKQVTLVQGQHGSMDSPGSMDKSMSPFGTESAQGNDDEDLGLYFGSPLVIKEENDSNDADMKRSNRRKSKPSKVVSSHPVEVDDDTENLEPHSGLDVTGQGTSSKRAAAEDVGDTTDPKRIRIQPEILLGENYCMADQSLEAIMKQVNENLYKNKDVLIAEEKEKENEKKGKSKSAKGKVVKRSVVGQPVTSTPDTKKSGARLIEPKPPIVLLVSSNTTPANVAPKIAIPNTPNLKMNLIKQEASSWSVSPKTKSKKDPNSSFSPMTHELFLKASKETDSKEYTCGQWGCSFSCIGFQPFEEHTLSAHGRYPCKFCSQTFTGRNNRTRHIRYHMTGKQHQCADCGKFFARPDSLKEHRFIHTKSYRDSNCCNCKIYFEKKATLLSHMKKCFSDDQLVTDKLSPEEIERESGVKKDANKDSSFSLRKELLNASGLSKPASKAAQPAAARHKEASDIGVMKAEYLQKEKQKIMDVKNYLDTQMAEMENVLETAAASPAAAGDHAMDEDDVTVIDLDAKAAAAQIAQLRTVKSEDEEEEDEAPREDEENQPPQPGFASSLISNIAMAVAEAEGSSAQTAEATNHAADTTDEENFQDAEEEVEQVVTEEAEDNISNDV